MSIPMEELITPVNTKYKLTQYSHGAGCGCKIAPSVLDTILSVAGKPGIKFPSLLVGNEEKDDAAVMDLGNGNAIISTTDFFMPIVDDPFTFGRIAATNAISDIYAMGGSPMMAIAILGWPINSIPPEIAGEVVRGAQKTCLDAGIPLAGGHSIDAPEPIFGLAVTGQVAIAHIKKNGGAQVGDVLFLTKPLGIGILSTAQKKEKLLPEHEHLAANIMIKLNSIGEQLGKLKSVHAMTDVTGFGLTGHLLEMCKASNTSARLKYDELPVIDPAVNYYIDEGCIPGGTNRNFASYSHEIEFSNPEYKNLACDPQTSGGLLIAVAPEAVDEITTLLNKSGLNSKSIGRMESSSVKSIYIQ
jgi:selenide,water dikinase